MAVLALALLMGISLGFFGAGGSILTVPLLVYGLGLAVKPAIATSLLVVGVTSAVAVVPHARSAHVRWSVGTIFGLAGMVGAYAGGRVGRLVPDSILLLLFCGMMGAAAIALWIGTSDRLPGSSVDAPAPRPRTLRLVSDGLGVGLLTGLVGVGGGFVSVPALVVLGGLPVAEAVGTSLVVVTLRCFAGFVGYRAHVEIDWELAVWLAVAAAIGSQVGAALTRGVRPEGLRRAFAVFLLVITLFVVIGQASSLSRS